MMKDKIELKKYYSTKEFLENYIYEENNLGVECTEEGTTFRLWSPQAECISLNLYQTGDAGGRRHRPGDPAIHRTRCRQRARCR